jgi:hypothetical protein
MKNEPFQSSGIKTIYIFFKFKDETGRHTKFRDKNNILDSIFNFLFLVTSD